MKKSKIIIPALGIICLTTAASVSGTVAWFTANNTYNQTIGDFQVARYDGNLSCHFQAGTGTTGSGSTTTIDQGTYYDSVVVNANALMTNASYDHNNGQHKVYFTTNPSSGFVDKTNVSNWIHGTSTVEQVTYTYYYAVSWTMRFDYAFAGDTANKTLRFDASASSMSKKTAGSDVGENKDVYKAFRIEMHVGSGTGLVYADNQTAANCSYVNGTSNSSVASYTNGTDLVDSTLSSQYNIGTFTTAAPSIVVNCVAWFEGSDPNINDTVGAAQLTAAYATVQATLAFDVVNAA